MLLHSLHELEDVWRVEFAELQEQSQSMWLTLMDQRSRVGSGVVIARHHRATPYGYTDEEYYRNGAAIRPPDYGYAYAKLKCCCSFTPNDVYRRENNMRLSYRCPIGPPGARGSIGDAGENGSAGQPGFNGQDYPSLTQPRRFEYGIQSTFSDYLPASFRVPVDCGTCPVGEPGVHGVPGKLGERGVSGVPGRNGIHGIPGGVGSTGPTGETGLRGRSGRSGLPGGRGLDGFKGAIGTPGPKGELGQTGLRGPEEYLVKPAVWVHLGQEAVWGLRASRVNEAWTDQMEVKAHLDCLAKTHFIPLQCKCPSRQSQPTSNYYYQPGTSSSTIGRDVNYAEPSASNPYYTSPTTNNYYAQLGGGKGVAERAVPANSYASSSHNYYSLNNSPGGGANSYLKAIHVEDTLSDSQQQQIHRDHLLKTKPLSTSSVGPPSQMPPAGLSSVSRVGHIAPRLPADQLQTSAPSATTEVDELPFSLDEDIDILKNKRRSH
uniref:Uncharacterized protein n=1 Tax=Ditylenchus dipsaci TaxID=166011 RepID=A0A915E258_9BILA